MNIDVHILGRDEAEILPYAFRHYLTFASEITLHDMGSTDNSLEIAFHHGVKVRHWDTKDKVDDRVNMRIKNECWLGTKADWVMVVDADEFIYFPEGAVSTLSWYVMAGLPLVRPQGYEMFSSVEPSGEGQIYDEIKDGARDDHWYGKPCVFSPLLVAAMEFAPGAHTSIATLKDGSTFGSPGIPTEPPFYLLHYHQIGPIERIAKKYDRTRSRMCEANVQHGWGNFEPGIKHALDKRNMILSRLERVIP